MSRRSILALAIALVVVLALAVIVYLLFLRPKPTPPPPTPNPTQSAFVSPLATTTEALHPPSFITPGADRRPQDAVTPSPAEGITVQLATSDGISLTATYWSPAASERVAAVILLHMLGRNRADWTPFAQQLQAAGIAALAVDLRGHGDSGGERDYSRMVQDVAPALTWLAQQAIVDQERIGIVGASIGANIALNYAATNAAIRAVALLSPGLDYQGITTEGPVVQYGSRPLLIVVSEDDTYAAESSQRLYELARSSQRRLQTYSRAGHGTDMLAANVGLAELLVGWLNQTLAPLPE